MNSTSLAAQSRGAPGWQVPPPQVSFTVQKSPSSHGLVLLVWTQPDAGLQESVVQGFWSLHAIGVCWQPSVESQVSMVHALLSSQSTGVRTQESVSSSHDAV